MKQVYTIQLNRQAQAAFMDVEVLDITVKSGDLTFAPQWEYLMAYKRSEIPWSHYVELYLADMTLSQKRSPERWEALLQKDTVALACYCPPGNPCHRHLLADLLMEKHLRRGEVCVLEGEIL